MAIKILHRVVAVLSLILFAYAANAQTYIGGEIYQDTTLKKEDEPYVVIESLYVAESVTLTVEAGVNVFFEPKLSLKIGGSLIAQGTETDSIYFGPSNPNGEQTWEGITFLAPAKDNTSVVSFEYCIITGSSDAPALSIREREDITIRHCRIYNNNYWSLNIYDCNNGLIENNTITDSKYGIYFSSKNRTSQNLVTGNKIHVTDMGIFLHDQDATTTENKMSYNSIFGSNVGIKFDGNINSRNNKILGNQIYDNQTGIKLSNHKNQVTKNVLHHNIRAVLIEGSDNNNGGDNNEFYANIFLENENGLAFVQQCLGNNIDTNRFIGNTSALRLGDKTANSEKANYIRYNTFRDNEEFAVTLEDSPQNRISHNSFFEGDSSMFYLLNGQDQAAPNNWWGTYIAQEIDQRIYDQKDEEQLGKVNYIPFLVSPPMNYLPPPENLIKQRVGDTLVVSWQKPNDERIVGFKIYYQNENGYAYKQIFDVGDANKAKYPGLEVTAEVAATSYDAKADGQTDQQENHESWFAKARLYPYAGRDQQICEGEMMTFPHATAFNYDSIRWVTDGNGQLIDPYSINPEYLHDVTDLDSDVTFWLNQYDSTGIKKDTLSAHFYPSAEVYAGQDTTILVDSSLVLDEATVQYADSIIWHTTGDGVYEDVHNINAVYHPGEEDMNNESVTLVIEATSRCGAFRDTINLRIEPTYTIAGRVASGNLPNGRLELYKANSEQSPRNATYYLEEDNLFSFNLVTEGNYYLLYLPKEPGEYFPTYYVDRTFWMNAHNVEVKANTYDLDIQPVEYQHKLPAGVGSINGILDQGNAPENIKNIIYLADTSGNMLDWVLPDNYGEFYFENLPYGNYRVIVQRFGVEPEFSEIITLTPDNSSV
ncbi:MAG: right-handed parallel beta-helix repeat-containing protein, partial [Bacteroidales bacterium]|nr:right-handed parallel beta-helix repeat-containing protein [Bacteroidales bacterium]